VQPYAATDSASSVNCLLGNDTSKTQTQHSTAEKSLANISHGTDGVTIISIIIIIITVNTISVSHHWQYERVKETLLHLVFV